MSTTIGVVDEQIYNQSLKPNTVRFFGSWDSKQPNISPLDNEGIDTINLKHALSMVDYNQLFLDSPDAIIANDDNILSSNLSKEFVDKVCSNNDGELAFIPSCECRELTGMYFSGSICPVCKTEVSSAFINKLAHSVWISIPDHFPPMINPIWYHILNGIPSIGSRGVKLMDAILDDTTNVPDQLQHIVTGRGFKWFYDNHETILDELFNAGGYNKAARQYIAWVKLLYKKFKHCMFFKKIPILHKELHPVLTNEYNVKQADRTSKEILDAVHDMTALALSKRNNTVSSKTFNRNFYKIYKTILGYHTSIIDNKLGDKMATIRHHCLGTRMHWSYRSVIVPIQGVHNADEIELPWALVVNMFKLHILNKLIKRGYDINKAVGAHMRALISYCPIIHGILQELIAECPWKGPVVLLGRNPKGVGYITHTSRAL